MQSGQQGRGFYRSAVSLDARGRVTSAPARPMMLPDQPVIAFNHPSCPLRRLLEPANGSTGLSPFAQGQLGTTAARSELGQLTPHAAHVRHSWRGGMSIPKMDKMPYIQSGGLYAG